MVVPLESLLKECRTGNQDAIRVLVQRFEAWARDLAECLLGDSALAEDAVQESFVTALERLPQLRNPAAFPGWFRQIVRTQCNRVLRRSREETLDRVNECVSEDLSPRELLERQETEAMVHDALRALSKVEHETATLFYLEGRTCREIASLLQVPLGTVKRRLHDSRRSLRDRLLGLSEEHSVWKQPRSVFRKRPL